MTINAINPKYQTTVNKAYKALRKYYLLVDLDDTIEPCSKAEERLLLKQEKAHDQYLDILDNLPAREKISLAKQHTVIHGYS